MQYVVTKQLESINTCNVEGVFNDASQAEQFAKLFSISDPEHKYAVYTLVRTYEHGEPVVSH